MTTWFPGAFSKEGQQWCTLPELLVHSPQIGAIKPAFVSTPQQTQELVGAIQSGFKSPLPHQVTGIGHVACGTVPGFSFLAWGGAHGG